MIRNGRCLNASEVAIAVPVVVPGIAVERLVPHITGNMLAKSLSLLAGADAAGIVLGTRVPIMLTSRGKAPMLLVATIRTTAHNNWKRYRHWQVPTLVLHGTADRVTHPEGSRKFYDTIASRDKTLHLVEGGHHELLDGVDRDETLRVILAWLERRLSPELTQDSR